MDSIKKKIINLPHKSAYGILLGLLLLSAALLSTPDLVARFLLRDHDITPGGINQLNSYRHLLSLAGLLILVTGLFPLEYKGMFVDTVVPPEAPSTSNRPKERLALVSILLLSLAAGFLAVLWLTSYGEGVTPDSLVYLTGAENLSQGNGYNNGYAPITHFPPLFPLVLAGISFLEPDLVQAARLLNALLFGLNAALFAWAVYLSSGRKFLPPVIASLFILSSQPLLTLHTQALTEPLFLAFTFVSLILLSRVCQQPGFFPFLLSALFLGLAVATRYIGFSFLPPAVIAFFLLQPSLALKRRIRDTVLWAALASLPPAVVMLRNYMIGETATNRIYSPHILPITEYLDKFGTSLGSFYVASPITFLWWSSALLLVMVFTIFLIFFVLNRRRKQPVGVPLGSGFVLVCFLFFVSYFVFLWFSISFLDASTPVDLRFVAPIAMILSVGLFSAFWHFYLASRRRLVWLFFLLCMVFSIGNRLPALIDFGATTHRDGTGFTARAWRESETLTFIRSLPSDKKIYSNASDVIRFLLERKANSIPKHTDQLTGARRTSYSKQMVYMCDNILEGRAVLAYFDLITWRDYLPTLEEIQAFCNPPVLEEFPDGVIFGDY